MTEILGVWEAGERVVVAVSRDWGASVSKSNDVARSVTGDIGKETDVFFDVPSPCAVTEVLDRGEGLDAEAGTECNNSTLPEAYDIGKADSHGRDSVRG